MIGEKNIQITERLCQT